VNEEDRRQVEADCTRLVAHYANLNDEARWDELAALYTEDAVMVRPTAPEAPLLGREAILAAFKGRAPRQARHLCTNVVISVEGPATARGRCAMVLLRPDAPPLVGWFDDRFALTEDGWRFAERRGSLSW